MPYFRSKDCEEVEVVIASWPQASAQISYVTLKEQINYRTKQIVQIQTMQSINGS